MQSFRDLYLLEASAPKIVMVYASPATNAYLNGWAKSQGFDLTKSYGGRTLDKPFDFHVTLLASHSDVDLPETKHEMKPVIADPSGYDVLGQDRRVPVLKLKPNKQLTDMRAHFMTTYGMTPTFETFIPHVSLSYVESFPDLDKLPLPSKKLIFDTLVVRVFDPK